MLPHLALGASQGIEDANLLAKLLGDPRVSSKHVSVSDPGHYLLLPFRYSKSFRRTSFKFMMQFVVLLYKSTGMEAEQVERSTKDVENMVIPSLVFNRICKT